jgi:energy-coupling factor transporter transmembrane protein EcfT
MLSICLQIVGLVFWETISQLLLFYLNTLKVKKSIGINYKNKRKKKQTVGSIGTLLGRTISQAHYY